MQFLIAALIVFAGGFLAVVSVVFGALMLTSANGPTRGNWIAHGALTYFVPIVIVSICIFLLIRTFR